MAPSIQPADAQEMTDPQAAWQANTIASRSAELHQIRSLSSVEKSRPFIAAAFAARRRDAEGRRNAQGTPYRHPVERADLREISAARRVSGIGAQFRALLEASITHEPSHTARARPSPLTSGELRSLGEAARVRAILENDDARGRIEDALRSRGSVVAGPYIERRRSRQGSRRPPPPTAPPEAIPIPHTSSGNNGSVERQVGVLFELMLSIQRSVRQELAAALQANSQANNQANPSLEAANGSAGASPTNDQGANTELPGAEPGWLDVPNPNLRGKFGTCAVCYESEVSTLLYSCGHLCCCSRCAYELHRRRAGCPIFRAPVRDIVQAFLCSRGGDC